jgi:Protein of unknown function DUF72
MPRAKTPAQWTELTVEERRERRRLRREKQREDNVKRAAKMHAARLKSETNIARTIAKHKQEVFVGCSGWRYWKWRDSFYEGVPQNDWFPHYLKSFDTVEINASFYSWPTVAGVQAWRRQPGKKKFVYTVKVSEHITHIKRCPACRALSKKPWSRPIHLAGPRHQGGCGDHNRDANEADCDLHGYRVREFGQNDQPEERQQNT